MLLVVDRTLPSLLLPSVAAIGIYWVTSSTTGFTVNCDTAPTGTFTFNYTVVGTELTSQNKTRLPPESQGARP